MRIGTAGWVIPRQSAEMAAGEVVEGFFEGGGVDGEVGREGEDLEVIHTSILGEMVLLGRQDYRS